MLMSSEYAVSFHCHSLVLRNSNRNYEAFSNLPFKKKIKKKPPKKTFLKRPANPSQNQVCIRTCGITMLKWNGLVERIYNINYFDKMASISCYNL